MVSRSISGHSSTSTTHTKLLGGRTSPTEVDRGVVFVDARLGVVAMGADGNFGEGTSQTACVLAADIVVGYHLHTQVMGAQTPPCKVQPTTLGSQQ